MFILSITWCSELASLQDHIWELLVSTKVHVDIFTN